MWSEAATSSYPLLKTKMRMPKLMALLVGFKITETAREKSRLIFGVKDDVDLQKLRCIILSRGVLRFHNPDQIYYVLLVPPSSQSYVGYERVGIATVLRKDVLVEKGGVEMKIV
jgi:hypothetical protein